MRSAHGPCKAFVVWFGLLVLACTAFSCEPAWQDLSPGHRYLRNLDSPVVLTPTGEVFRGTLVRLRCPGLEVSRPPVYFMLYQAGDDQELDSTVIDPAVRLTGDQMDRLVRLIMTHACPGYVLSRDYHLSSNYYAVELRKHGWHPVVLHEGSEDEKEFIRRLFAVLDAEQVAQLRMSADDLIGIVSHQAKVIDRMRSSKS